MKLVYSVLLIVIVIKDMSEGYVMGTERPWIIQSIFAPEVASASASACLEYAGWQPLVFDNTYKHLVRPANPAHYIMGTFEDLINRNIQPRCNALAECCGC